jgi:hypothetical protein
MARVSNTGASEGTSNSADKVNKKKVRCSPKMSDLKLTLPLSAPLMTPEMTAKELAQFRIKIFKKY